MTDKPDRGTRWRRPRWFHAVLRFGERCEHWIALWRIATPGSDAPRSEVDAVMHRVETLIRNPRTGPDKLRELRRWAATKIAPGTRPEIMPATVSPRRLVAP